MECKQSCTVLALLKTIILAYLPITMLKYAFVQFTLLGIT